MPDIDKSTLPGTPRSVVIVSAAVSGVWKTAVASSNAGSWVNSRSIDSTPSTESTVIGTTTSAPAHPVESVGKVTLLICSVELAASQPQVEPAPRVSSAMIPETGGTERAQSKTDVAAADLTDNRRIAILAPDRFAPVVATVAVARSAT